MAIFKGRFSREDLIVIFVYAAFPIHVWTIVNMLKDVPSWALYMRNWELVSTVGYTLAFALVETLIVFFPFVLIGMVIPRSWVHRLFVPWASVMLVEGAIAAILFQNVILTYGPKKSTLAMIFGAMAISSVIILWSTKLKGVVRNVAKRFSTLVFLYVFLDLVGLAIVIARNI